MDRHRLPPLAAPREPVGVGRAHRNAEGRPCSDGQHDVEAHGRVEGVSPLKGPRVLYSDDKSTADRDALASWIRRAERRAGLSITGRLHILRHTFCSRLAIRAATTKAIQELAGHVSLTTTQRYMPSAPPRRRARSGCSSSTSGERSGE